MLRTTGTSRPLGRIDGDRQIDVPEQDPRVDAGSYQAFSAGSARQAAMSARINRSM